MSSPLLNQSQSHHTSTYPPPHRANQIHTTRQPHPVSYDLRSQPWIPWRRRSGSIAWGAPALLVDRLDEDPVVGLSAPRPDFEGALQEFLIGLLSVSLQPRNDTEWLIRWHLPPTSAELQAALDALPSAFDLDGDGPRFFQDVSAADLADAEPAPIEQLLIDAPGEQTAKLNKDLFVKRSRVDRLGYPAAAMALLTLQTYAPSGGQGHRTSLRGGGPLTTLVDPRVSPDDEWHPHDQPLWRKLWANVETSDQWSYRTSLSSPPSAAPDIFPWLAPTRVSVIQGRATTPDDAHPLQAYFGLPRRIRLEVGGAGQCDLTGNRSEHTVVGFRMRNYGVQYAAWKHPLSPYYRTKPAAEWLPLHGRPGGVGWRDWLALTFRSPQAVLREPAQAIAAFHDRSALINQRNVRLHAFGYDMDNMKARGWTEAALPAFAIADEAARALLAATAAQLTEGTSIAASALLSAVERALFQRPEDAPGDRSQVKAELWAVTEESFYSGIRGLASSGASTEADGLRLEFAGTLEEQATRVFDRWCSDVGTTPEALRRLVSARFNLVMTLRGYSKLGEKLFMALGIPIPGGGRAARVAKSRSRKEATT